MTERTYIIRQQDRKTATTFIDNQLNKNPQWLGVTEAQYNAAKQEYLVSKTSPTSFNTWCQKWLKETQWAEIRKAINTNKNHEEERWRYIEPHKTISVTHHAWEILSTLALQDQLSPSEVIINRLGKKLITSGSPTKSRYNQNN
ncbi:hypothetical protein Nstercoris_02103 [Nitrosomonas stercoris]|uniref:Uncharacterized protein n=1 Tax=Nitrosomonas stercoris TaxID=1444684 RepID=A0A4Y1YNU9_9PROT|nr:hypothetical protein Nstercoris_02103 [Nitrosomonas stercoris]